MSIIIALWCADRHVHNCRTTALANYINTKADDVQHVICSGGIVWENTISEAQKMKNELTKHKTNDNVTIHTENISTDTAKNIRNSINLILENNLLQENIRIGIFTSAFHVERTRQFAEYILQTEFPELKNLQISVIAAEEYANDSQKRHLLPHQSWKKLIKNFEEWEKRWLAVPVEERERNKPVK